MVLSEAPAALDAPKPSAGPGSRPSALASVFAPKPLPASGDVPASQAKSVAAFCGVVGLAAGFIIGGIVLKR